MQFYAIPCIIANVTKKHMSEDDILFTKPLAGIGLSAKVQKNKNSLNHLNSTLKLHKMMNYGKK